MFRLHIPTALQSRPTSHSIPTSHKSYTSNPYQNPLLDLWDDRLVIPFSNLFPCQTYGGGGHWNYVHPHELLTLRVLILSAFPSSFSASYRFRPKICRQTCENDCVPSPSNLPEPVVMSGKEGNLVKVEPLAFLIESEDLITDSIACFVFRLKKWTHFIILVSWVYR